MNKAFLAFASMIVTGFILKSYKKLKEKPATKEEVYRAMKAAEYNRRKRDLGALRPSNDQCDAMAMASNGCAMMGVSL